jgi:hypothetical protein
MNMASDQLGAGRADAEVPRIAAIQGADSRDVQALLETFVRRLGESARVAGVIEERPSRPGSGVCDPMLRNLCNGRLYPLFQDLGPCSTACGLDGEKVMSVCEEVSRDIGAGCDLVVLNKFARLEAERTGLIGAFTRAIEANRPILTSVSPKFDEAWRRFAAPLFVMLRPDLQEIEAWWSGISAAGEQRQEH